LLSGVEQAPPDPVLGITEAFRADSSPDKLNLGVGAYRTEELQPYVLSVVRAAEQRMLAANENKEYLAIEGLPGFRKATAELLLGAASPALAAGRVATLQALSGTGSLTVGAQFLAAFMPGKTVYISNPTWCALAPHRSSAAPGACAGCPPAPRFPPPSPQAKSLQHFYAVGGKICALSLL
jgi:aspartate aminotransferase